MQKNKSAVIALVFLLLSLVSKDAFAQNYGNKDDLKGFDTLFVLVEHLSPELTASGFTTDQIRIDAEKRLRQAGLKINKPSPIYLYIEVGAIKTAVGLAGNILVGLKQRVVLSRNNSVYFPANTWESRGLYVTSREEANSYITQVISEHVDRFIDAYREANEDGGARDSPPPPPAGNTKPDDSPFTATYVGGNKEPEVEVFNDSNRTLYLDLGKGQMTAHTILSGTSKKIYLTDGNWNYKASAPRVRTLTGTDQFKRGYSYTWRFTIITVTR